jgi:predicted DNA binding CopG/RHH family protein
MKQAQEGQERKDDKVCLNVSRAVRDALKLSATARGITLGEYVKEILTGEKQ